jgi:DNA polymerase elongation subunit (family B)
LAACVGCGRLFVVKRDKGGDDNDDGGNGGIDGGKLISAPKLTSTQVQRMTARQPDGSIVLEWGDKTEVVAPDDLKCWQDIDAIPEISLPAIENIPIPPTIVLDLETVGLDPRKGRILAAGLALFIEGKEVEAKIIRSDDEADSIAQVFDYLRETCDGLGEIILTGYNLAEFDLPFLIHRARKLKVDCPFRFAKDDNGEIKRWLVAATEGTLRGDPLDYPAIVTDLPIRIVDTLHLVARWDYVAKALRHYDLKSVAVHFGVNPPNRPILTPSEIRHAYQHDWATFKAYLLADLRETFALFSKLVTPYIAVAALTKLPIDQVVTRSTAWIWQQILHRHYGYIPDADEKQKYKGGLVVSRKGLWSPCMKVDIASLYPTIMLAYRIHSRKDTDQIALRWLKALTRQRLALKAKAKAGNANAQILQEAMKILINSLYGFYGTGGYGFNDMTAAERVTCVGRKILAAMIAAVEDAGGIVVETDTDGLIVCYRNAEPEQILQAVTAAIPEVFKVELEWQEAICFVSDDKNYIVLPKDGDPIMKGSKWRGRDKEAFLTQAIPEFVRLWALEGREAAMAYAAEILDVISSGKGWRWVVRSHRVGKGDKFLIEAGFKVGDVATYAYRDKKKSTISRQPEEGYDCLHYARQFGKIIKEVIEAVNPEAWKER